MVALTASADADAEQRCLEAGMDDYVAKPVEAAALFKAVEAVPANVLASPDRKAAVDPPSLSSDAKPVAEEGQGKTFEPTAIGDSTKDKAELEVAGTPETITLDASAPLIDWSVALKNMPGGKEVALDLAGLLLDEAPKLVDQIRAARQEQDAEVFRRAAHTLKGSAAIFSITPLVEMCEQIEAMARAEEFSAAENLVEELTASASQMTLELEAFIQTE